MPNNAKVAAVQMASGPSVDSNLLEAGQLIADAARAGADIVVLPENFAFMCAEHKELLSCREPAGEGPIQSFLSEQARRHGIWLVGGTIPLTADSWKTTWLTVSEAVALLVS